MIDLISGNQIYIIIGCVLSFIIEHQREEKKLREEGRISKLDYFIRGIICEKAN